MNACLIANVIALLILLIGQELKIRRNLMPAAILFLICFYGIRQDYGNDFPAYKMWFEQSIRHSIDYFLVEVRNMEIGWVILCRLFSFADFQLFVFFMTIVQFSIVGWFISKYCPPAYRVFVLALYLFWPSLMVIGLSMMRQTLAMGIVLLSVPWILKKKWIKATALILFATLFHTSAYAALPLVIFPWVAKWDYRWLLIIFFTVLGIAVAVPKDIFRLFVLLTSSGDFERYSVYMTVSNVQTRFGFGYIFQLITAVYLIFILKYKSTSHRFFVVSLLMNYMLSPITGAVGMVARLMYYYNLVGIVGIVPLVKRARTDAVAMILCIGFFFLIVLSFTRFFYEPIWTRKFLHYHTIFG